MNKKVALNIVKEIRDYMVKNYLDRLRLSSGERILFNKKKSINKALGMFLLLKKSLFNVNARSLTNIQRQVLDKLTFKTNLSVIEGETNAKELQYKFEEYTEKILKEYFKKVCRVDQEKMNEYDFKVNDEVTVEVKSDRWMSTGNISLELLRDYKSDYDRNMGSILKTEATFWQVYYYDAYKGSVSSEVFLVCQLKAETYKVLERAFKEIEVGNGF